MFFYGAFAQGIGGEGMVLFISPSHFFHMKLGCGGSTNIRVELLAPWALLLVAKYFGIPEMKIFGDSKVIIN